jgi:hypothetical protein
MFKKEQKKEKGKTRGITPIGRRNGMRPRKAVGMRGVHVERQIETATTHYGALSDENDGKKALGLL